MTKIPNTIYHLLLSVLGTWYLGSGIQIQPARLVYRIQWTLYIYQRFPLYMQITTRGLYAEMPKQIADIFNIHPAFQ